MLTYESHHFGQNNDFNYYHNYDFNFPKHLHRSFEFMYVKSGQINVSINTRNFCVNEGECILILPYEIHSFTTITPSDSYICVFSPEYIKTFHNMVYEKYIDNPVITLSPGNQSLILDKIFNSNSDLFEMKAGFYLICSELMKQSKILDNDSCNYELLHRTLNYIQNNFTNNISLKSISLELGYSYNYLSKYLNNMLGTSFVDFINENRINYALYLLKNTEDSITDIAYACGYSSIRSFNRNFLNLINMTPKSYRNS